MDREALCARVHGIRKSQTIIEWLNNNKVPQEAANHGSWRRNPPIVLFHATQDLCASAQLIRNSCFPIYLEGPGRWWSMSIFSHYGSLFIDKILCFNRKLFLTMEGLPNPKEIWMIKEMVMTMQVVPGFLSKQLSQKQENKGILPRTAELYLKEFKNLPLMVQQSRMKHLVGVKISFLADKRWNSVMHLWGSYFSAFMYVWKF